MGVHQLEQSQARFGFDFLPGQTHSGKKQLCRPSEQQAKEDFAPQRYQQRKKRDASRQRDDSNQRIGRDGKQHRYPDSNQDGNHSAAPKWSADDEPAGSPKNQYEGDYFWPPRTYQMR